MSRPSQDKVSVAASYDTNGRCVSIIVYLNDTVVSAEDVAFAVRSVFRPDSGITVSPPKTWTPPTTLRDRSQADTITDLQITDGSASSRKWF